MIERIFFGFFFLSLTGCATVSNVQPINSYSRYDNYTQYNDKQYLVAKTDQRLNSPDEYFRKERDTLKTRRKLNQLSEPANDEIGLSFSGGGIRSNAFQLGLLSGLYEKNFLKKVDYISAVSGGSWAAGAYKAYAKNDRELFEALDAIVRRDDLEITNDKHMRPLFNSYEKALDEIISSKKDILDFHLGSPSQEDWRKMLRTNVLNNNDILLDQLNKKRVRHGLS
jgi:predicted acylesterase/phospholipase RssA